MNMCVNCNIHDINYLPVLYFRSTDISTCCKNKQLWILLHASVYCTVRYSDQLQYTTYVIICSKMTMYFLKWSVGNASWYYCIRKMLKQCHSLPTIFAHSKTIQIHQYSLALINAMLCEECTILYIATIK